MTREEATARNAALVEAAMICATEMATWRDDDDSLDDRIKIGAIGASANCCAAILQLAALMRELGEENP